MINLKELSELLNGVKESKAPPTYLVLGATGIGKSSVIRKAFSSEGYYLLCPPPLSAINAEDLVGVPFPKDNGYYEYLPPKWLKIALEESTKYGRLCIFWDEVNRAGREVRNSLISALDLSNPRIGDLPIPHDTIHVCAANPESYQDTASLGEALLGRMIVVETEPDFDMWLGWAKDNVHSLIIDFLKENPSHFFDKGSDGNEAGACPRNWEKLSRVLYTHPHIVEDTSLFNRVVPSCIKGAAFVALTSFVETRSHVVTASEFITDSFEVPEELESILYLMEQLSEYVDTNPNEFERLVEVSSRIPPEYIRGMVIPKLKERGFFRRNADLVFGNANFTQWIKRYS